MALPKIQSLQQLTLQEIQEKIILLKIDIFKLKLQQITKQNIKTHIFKHKKHELAQLLTLEAQKKE